MNDLTVRDEAQLPVLLPDLARFVLIGREKMVALAAEIRAIDKLWLAKEVEEQKREEARRLSDLIVVAATRIGDLTKQMAKSSGGRPPKTNSAVANGFSAETDLQLNSNGASKFRADTKAQKIKDLGLSPWQVSRFETMASHPAEVAQAREEAEVENRPVTQAAVLSLIKHKEEKRQAEYRQIDEDCRLTNLLSKALCAVRQLPTDEDSIAAMRRGGAFADSDTRAELAAAIDTLTLIQRGYQRGGIPWQEK